jgi:LPXTG-motif cell wall-anchored protein
MKKIIKIILVSLILLSPLNNFYASEYIAEDKAISTGKISIIDSSNTHKGGGKIDVTKINKKNILPQTNETNNIKVIIYGLLILLLIFHLIYIKNNKRRET